MSEPVKAKMWAVKGPDGGFTCFAKEKEWTLAGVAGMYRDSWDELSARGYTIAPVEVREIKESGR